jgi:hypothetical protein
VAILRDAVLAHGSSGGGLVCGSRAPKKRLDSGFALTRAPE